MTWKQFVRRFNEIMADTGCTPLGVTDLEAWHRKQKEITERRLQEEQEKREIAKNWMKQDAYRKALAANAPVVIDTLIDKDEFVLPMLPPGGSIDDIIVSVQK